MIEFNWLQAREQFKIEWAVQSLDFVLGLVGGLAGTLWALLGMLFGGYETFKFENSLIGAVYPTSPDDDDQSLSDEMSAKQTMMQTVALRGKYFYNYSDYLASCLIPYLFCCCIRDQGKGGCLQLRLKKLQRHKAASERLAKEIDICKLLYVQRVAQFIAKLILKKHQRALVSNFKSYQLENLEPTTTHEHQINDEDKESGLSGRESGLPSGRSIYEDGAVQMFAAFENDETLTEDQLKLLKEISGAFRPHEDAADLAILFETTGFQAATTEKSEFWESYNDYGVLGEETNMVATSRDERKPKKSEKDD